MRRVWPCRTINEATCSYASCGHVFDTHNLFATHNNNNTLTFKCSSCKRPIYYFIPCQSLIDPLNHGLSLLVTARAVPPELVEYNGTFAHAPGKGFCETARQYVFWASFLSRGYKAALGICLLFAFIYLYVEADLIPDDTPVFGYFDDAAMFFLVVVLLVVFTDRTVFGDLTPVTPLLKDNIP